MEIIKLSKAEFEELKKKTRQLSDEDLDKVAGGRLPCYPGCIYADNHCACPNDEDDV